MNAAADVDDMPDALTNLPVVDPPDNAKPAMGADVGAETGTDQAPKVLPFSTRLLAAPDSRRSEAGPSGQNALEPSPNAFLMERNPRGSARNADRQHLRRSPLHRRRGRCTTKRAQVGRLLSL